MEKRKHLKQIVLVQLDISMRNASQSIFITLHKTKSKWIKIQISLGRGKRKDVIGQRAGGDGNMSNQVSGRQKGKGAEGNYSG